MASAIGVRQDVNSSPLTQEKLATVNDLLLLQDFVMWCFDQGYEIKGRNILEDPDPQALIDRYLNVDRQALLRCEDPQLLAQATVCEVQRAELSERRVG